jgi:hypothetical protein
MIPKSRLVNESCSSKCKVVDTIEVRKNGNRNIYYDMNPTHESQRLSDVEITRTKLSQTAD